MFVCVHTFVCNFCVCVYMSSFCVYVLCVCIHKKCMHFCVYTFVYTHMCGGHMCVCVLHVCMCVYQPRSVGGAHGGLAPLLK